MKTKHIIIYTAALIVTSLGWATGNNPKKVRCSQGNQSIVSTKGVATADPKPAGHSETPVTRPVDPNEIVGPEGWMVADGGDTTRWVNGEQSLPYTIYFENDPEVATAAALTVTVRMKLHPLMNPASLSIGSFGFGNRVFAVEGSPLQYQTRLDLREEMDLYIDVVAGIDITTGEAFWIFSSIDPATGVAPTESERGFLAVNDSTHVGEGYVTFTIKPRTALCHTGDTIGAQASIVFDINDPIVTNRWVNTVDATKPVSTMQVVRQTCDSLYFVFAGSDDATGIAQHTLYYTVDGCANREAGSYAAGDTAAFARQSDVQYTFFSIATDNVGNTEPLKGQPDTAMGNSMVHVATSVTPAGAATVTGGGTYNRGDTIRIAMQAAEGYRLQRWSQEGVTLAGDSVLVVVPDADMDITAEMALNRYSIAATAGEGTTLQVVNRATGEVNPTTVLHFDSVAIGMTADACYEEARIVLNGQPIGGDTVVVATGDMTISTQATLRPTAQSETAASTCDSLLWNGEWRRESGDYTYATTTAAGCDSTATLKLTVNQKGVWSESMTVCDSYTWKGTTYTASGSYTFDTLTVQGCDSTVTLHLSINHSSSGTESATACDRYTWHGAEYTASTDEATYTTTNAAGCDSTVTLMLTINHSSSGTESATACDKYTWHGTEYTASTDEATYTTTNAAGCDSTVTLMLTINHSADTTIVVSAEGEYVWNGEVYNESGTYTWTGVTAEGCDSTVTMVLMIEPVGIDEADALRGAVRIYPNPTSGWLTVDGDGIEKIEVYEMTGRKVMQTENANRINLSGQAAGEYIVVVNHRHGSTLYKVLVQR